MGNKGYDTVIRAVKVALMGLTLLSFAKAIWISLDIDESYAVACAYRMTRGDRLVRDMWEPHQFSAFLTALFAAPFIRIRGNTDYLVIWLRVMGGLIHAGMGCLLTGGLFLLCLLRYMSHGFSLQNPEFFHWIEENYRDAQQTETEHLVILRKQG